MDLEATVSIVSVKPFRNLFPKEERSELKTVFPLPPRLKPASSSEEGIENGGGA